MSNDWLEQLRQLHDADKAKHQTQIEAQQQKEQQKKARRKGAIELLRKSQAHELLRQVQKTLLDGGGSLEIADNASHYERVITLIWQGPISAARKPDPEAPEDYYYILVGAREGKVWVNGKPLRSATPEALKAALLEAGKNPSRQKRSK